MKKLLLLLLVSSLTLLCTAQPQMPDSIAGKPATISLKMKYHAFIIALMPDHGSTDAIRYINQVAKAVTGTTVDTSVNVSVTVPYRLVANMYYTIGCQQERLAAPDNASIKPLLFTQLSAVPAYADLLQVIQNIANGNTTQTEQIRTQGQQFILSVK